MMKRFGGLKKAICGAMALAMGLGVVAEEVGAAGSADARKIVAVLDATQNFGSTRRAVNFYDVTDLSGSSVFDQTPLFSVWTGYEDSLGTNFEDPGAISINPFNGTVYQLAFDSGSVGVADAAGDTQGDYDLYRIDYQEILDDFVTNSRPKGTMYAPSTTPDGFANVDHPDHIGSTVFLSSSIAKVGEVGRAAGTSFFDYDLEFINPETLVLLDNESDSNIDTPAEDHELRLLKRVTQLPTYNAATNEGGFNRQTTELWSSNIAAKLELDGSSQSEPTNIAFVERDGVIGVWVNDSDPPDPNIGSDFNHQVAFFEIDLNNMTATKKEQMVGAGNPYPTSFRLDEDPTVSTTTNDGDLDWIRIDENGNLLIGESGFFDGEEPKLITREIEDYDVADSDASGQNEIDFGAWGVSANLPQPTADDDTAVTDGRFVTYDKDTGYIYFFDIDSGGLPDVVADVYVFDPATGTFVYEEQNAVNHFTERNAIELFRRGDLNGDGKVTADDIDGLDAISNGGPTALQAEQYDLTGDLLLSTARNAAGSDMDELVMGILGTDYGDGDLDGDVDTGDLTVAITNFTGASGTGKGWADGNTDGDTDVDTADLTEAISNFTGASAANPNVPDLVYDPATGNVTIDADGADVISFSLQSGPFNAADFSELPAGLTDNIASQIGWTSFNLFSGLTGTANLGAILPAGLDLAGLEAALATASYGLALAGGGGGGRLDLIIPEPASMVLMGLGAVALVRRRRAA